MIAAYTVILVGGLLITARLRLLATAVTFWVSLAVGIGILAASGHCMTARWAFAPVCGFDFWRVIVISPEVLIFLFFMITDPKTVPSGRVGRILFGLLVAVASTLLMAPQTTEFSTKVALLGGLVLMCAIRPVVDRLVPEPRSTADELRRLARGLASGDATGDATGGVIGGTVPGGRLLGGAARVALAGAAVLAVGAGIVVAGTPARGTIVPDATDVLGRVPHDVDPATFPSITVAQDVSDWNHEIAGPGARELVLTLAENLELEGQALLREDPSILEAVDHGDRLDEMRARLEQATTAGTTAVDHFEIDDIHVSLLVPFGRQDGLSLGLDSRGTKTTETYDDAGHLQSRSSAPFEQVFVLRRATGGRWLNVAVLPARSSG
jgi:hypothetical protein